MKRIFLFIRNIVISECFSFSWCFVIAHSEVFASIRLDKPFVGNPHVASGEFLDEKKQHFSISDEIASVMLSDVPNIKLHDEAQLFDE